MTASTEREKQVIIFLLVHIGDKGVVRHDTKSYAWRGRGRKNRFIVFSVDVVFKEDLNLMLLEASQGAVGLG